MRFHTYYLICVKFGIVWDTCTYHLWPSWTHAQKKAVLIVWAQMKLFQHAHRLLNVSILRNARRCAVKHVTCQVSTRWQCYVELCHCPLLAAFLHTIWHTITSQPPLRSCGTSLSLSLALSFMLHSLIHESISWFSTKTSPPIRPQFQSSPLKFTLLNQPGWIYRREVGGAWRHKHDNKTRQ
jgi:hypothetical protein